MGCGVSKIDNREEEEMEDDSMYVYYNLLPRQPKDKDNNGVPGPNTTKADEVAVVEFESCVIEQAPAGRVMKERNNVVSLSGDHDHESAGTIVEEDGIDHNNAQQRRESRGQLSEKENTPHLRSPSVGNYRFSGVHGSGETAKYDDGEIIRMKKLDSIIDGEKEEEEDNEDACTEIILSTHHPLREFALREKQLPRSLSLKKNRRKWRQFKMPGPRSCSGSVKNLPIDDLDSRYYPSPTSTRKSCSRASDIHVKYYSLQV